jgi:hypothetical protein
MRCALKRVGLAKYRSNQCDRIRHIGADVATIRPLPGIRRSLYRLVSRSN